MQELEFYSFIRIEKHRRDPRQNRVSLNVDLDELIQSLNDLDK